MRHGFGWVHQRCGWYSHPRVMALLLRRFATSLICLFVSLVKSVRTCSGNADGSGMILSPWLMHSARVTATTPIDGKDS